MSNVQFLKESQRFRCLKHTACNITQEKSMVKRVQRSHKHLFVPSKTCRVIQSLTHSTHCLWNHVMTDLSPKCVTTWVHRSLVCSFCKHSPILMNLHGNICSSILCFSVNVSLLKSFLRPLGLEEEDSQWPHHITRSHFPKHYSHRKKHNSIL